jgi:LacI family transcriptional regulator/LacI family asc operon transcriptional repressor
MNGLDLWEDEVYTDHVSVYKMMNGHDESMNIYDIAERCGVSIATVSRVLNGSQNVSAKTRGKVLGVMREEGYTPNAFARGLGLNTMRMIGVLCTDVSDTFYAKAVSLVESDLRRRGFDSLLCSTGNDLAEKKKFLKLLLAKRVDAVILIGSAFRENVDNSHIENAARQVPVVVINGLVELPGVYCVLCDERSAVTRNVGLLHRQGCEHILYLYDAPTYSGCEKIQGYKEGLRNAGLPFREELLARVPKSVDGASDAVSALLGRGIPISAVMASEDLLAVGAQKALQKAGRSVPVIGFNNSILAQCASPALTSVDNMLETLCPSAVSLLADLLEEKSAPQKIVISPRLVERDTFHTGQNQK